jgi:hypothetical protein
LLSTHPIRSGASRAAGAAMQTNLVRSLSIVDLGAV